MGKPLDVNDRFWSKVSSPDENGCRVWTASRHRLGYGHFRLNGKVEASHRVAFLLHHGREPEDCLLHSCDNRACCEPSHLREGSHKDNMEECALRGRSRSPRAGNGKPKLTLKDRASITSRFHSGENNKSALAREFGVSPSRIRQVIRNG